MHQFTRVAVLAFLFALTAVLSSFPVQAASTSQQSSTIAQGFQIDESNGEIGSGTLVSLKNNSTKIVEAASQDNVTRLMGVVDTKPLLTITDNTKKAQVVLSGSTSALVSDINGKIEVGDSITPSPIAGVGMKANNGDQVIGIAGSSSQGEKSVTITDKEGVKHKVSIGRASVQVSIGRYQTPGSGFLPPAIQSVADGIAGQQVTAMRVLIAIAILIIGFAIVLIVVFTSVRSSVTSIGRNPLAAKDIRRGLFQVLAVAVALAIATCLTAYLIIRI